MTPSITQIEKVLYTAKDAHHGWPRRRNLPHLRWPPRREAHGSWNARHWYQSRTAIRCGLVSLLSIGDQARGGQNESQATG